MFSFIISVYNSENTIHRCVESILELEFIDYEVILVDDGSTDASGEICDEYENSNSRIVVIHKSNGGNASARNAGLNIAQGKWIIFCDSDDFYDTSSLFELILLIQNVKNENCLIGYNFRNVWPDHIEKKGPYPSAYEQMKEKADNIKFVSSSKSHNMMGFAIWDKLYSKEIIDHYSLRFLERDKVGNKDDWAEDLFFNLQYMMQWYLGKQEQNLIKFYAK